MSLRTVISSITPAWNSLLPSYAIKDNSGVEIGPCLVQGINILRSYPVDISPHTDTITLRDGANGPILFQLNTGWVDNSNTFPFSHTSCIPIPGDGIYFSVGPWVTSADSTTHGNTANTFVLVCAVPVATTTTWLDVVDSQTSLWRQVRSRVEVRFSMTAEYYVDTVGGYDICGTAYLDTYYPNTGSASPRSILGGRVLIANLYDQLWDMVGNFSLGGFPTNPGVETLESISVPALGKTYTYPAHYSALVYPFSQNYNPDNPSQKFAMWEFNKPYDGTPLFGFVAGVTYEVIIVLRLPPDYSFTSWVEINN